MSSLYTIQNVSNDTVAFAHAAGTYYIAADATQDIDLSDSVAKNSLRILVAAGKVAAYTPSVGSLRLDLGSYTFTAGDGSGKGSIVDLGAGSHAAYCSVTMASAMQSGDDLWVYLFTGPTPTEDGSWYRPVGSFTGQVEDDSSFINGGYCGFQNDSQHLLSQGFVAVPISRYVRLHWLDNSGTTHTNSFSGTIALL